MKENEELRRQIAQQEKQIESLKKALKLVNARVMTLQKALGATKDNVRRVTGDVATLKRRG